MRELTPLEKELSILKRHNSYLSERMAHAVSTGELRMLESAMKVNNEGIASIESELESNVCGACGQFFPTNQADSEGFHSADYCEEAGFCCGSCGYGFPRNEGVIIADKTQTEFVCNECYGEGK